MAKDYGQVIGIDLGTTYSCVAIWRNGAVEIIANDQGNRTTPSYVSFNETERLIGEPAKNQAVSNYKNTVFDAKRLIGRKFNEESVQNDLKHFPFKVVSGDGDKPLIEVEYMNETKKFSPEEISSMILYKMKQTAESYLGTSVTHAVVTVPAYFNDSQRQATMDAGRICGLNILRIINEPTAAAIAYGMDKTGDRKVLIFDFGGGTLDVSVLEISDGFFEVKSTSGDTHCGGEDLDNRIVQYCLSEFCKKNKLTGDNANELLNNAKAKRRLRTECEKAKRILSSSTMTTVQCDSFYMGIDLSLQLSRSRFEELCNDIFHNCMKPVEKALLDAKYGKSDIDDIVLVGGSTRIPKIQDSLERFFGKKPKSDVNPDEAVAYGAAVQARILSSNNKDEKLDGIVLVDVIPLSLGVETSGGIMTKIIERNTTKPCSKEEVFSTYSDNQPGVTIKVYEGERQFTKDNNQLGTFDLSGIPPAPRGVPRIKIKYSVDENGILTVSAKEEGTGKESKITITNDKGRMSKEEIESKIKEAEKYESEDKKRAERIQARNSFENTLYNARNQLDNAELKAKLSEEQQKQLTDIFNRNTKWLEDNEDATTENITEQEKVAQKEISTIFASVYQQEVPPEMPQDNSTKPIVEELD